MTLVLYKNLQFLFVGSKVSDNAIGPEIEPFLVNMHPVVHGGVDPHVLTKEAINFSHTKQC